MEIVSVIRLLVILLLVALLVIFATRRLQVPYTLGLVVVGLLISVVGSLFGYVSQLQLTPELVLFVFLPALLFEGSWAISVKSLRDNWVTIFLLAGPGLLLELVLIAVPLHYFIHLNWSVAFLLAAILSPTDPVAVLGLFRQLKVNEDLSMIIEGESLFNDGVAGVLYQVFLVVVLSIAQGTQPTFGLVLRQGLGTFVLQAGGGVLLGAFSGLFISRFVKFVNDSLIETTITIVTAYGVYLIANALQMSGILAVIIAALIVGSYGVEHGMTEETKEAVDGFWTMIAFLANALLFLLVGVQLNPFEFVRSGQFPTLLLAAGLVVLAVFVARYIMVLLLPLVLPATLRKRIRVWRFVLIWSGLRGALSLALVLALPLNVPDRTELIFSTYAVVLFTLLVQGFSVRYVLHHTPAVEA